MSRQSARIGREGHDEPHVKGTRITVQFIHARVEGRGLEPATAAAQYDFELADVYHALAYYHDHPEVMREVAEQHETRIEAAASEPYVATGPEDVDR